jgi:hypothetical protein
MAERTIILKGERLHIRKEGIADSAIIPGHLVALASDGKFDVHGAAKGPSTRSFAIERELENHWSGNAPLAGTPIDVAYAQNDRLLYAVCSPGCEVYALVAAGAAAIVKGDHLESAGDGTLRKRTAEGQLTSGNYTYTSAGNSVAIALEAVDNSGGGSVARIIVEVQ